MSSSRELAFLRIVAQTSGVYGWHGIETRLAGQDPYKPSAVQLATRLAAIGIVEIVPRGTHDAYAITERGRAALAEIEANGWQLGPFEIRELATELAGQIPQRLTALAPYFEADFGPIAQQLGAAGLALEHLAWAAQVAMRENRSVVAFPFATDPDPDRRRQLFLAWGGPGEGAESEARFRAPGPAYEWDRDPLFVDLLHAGLVDVVAGVRDAAARLAHMTLSGHHVVPDLLADLASDAPSRWSAAALGTARDPDTLAVLRRLLDADEQLAGGVVRALAARPDGRAEFFAALRDPRKHVAWTARCSLGYIATDLTIEEIAAIERNADQETLTALAYYHSRHLSRS